jgi:hypothetical protein
MRAASGYAQIVSSGARTPQQAVLDDLARPMGQWEPLGNPGPGGVVASTVRGGRVDVVDLATVRFVKERRSPTRRALFVTYSAVNPQFGSELRGQQATYEVVEVADGVWETRGWAGGGGDPPPWDKPTVNLGGGGWPGGFYAGGVLVSAPTVSRVRLEVGNGEVLEDSVDDGGVVFVTDAVVTAPMTAVLLDDRGHVVRRHSVLPGPMRSDD